MKKWMPVVLFGLLFFCCTQKSEQTKDTIGTIGKTVVSIQGESFHINGEPTYKGR